MKNLFLVMLANEVDVRDHVFDRGYALYPATLQGYDTPNSLGAASNQVKKYVKEINECVDLIKGVAVCSPLFPYLCEVKYLRPTEDWEMLMQLHKSTILSVLDRFDLVEIRIVEVDEPTAPVLTQIAQEFGIEITYAPKVEDDE